MSDAKDRQAVDGGRVVASGTGWDFAMIGRIPVSRGPISGMAATPDGSRLLVVNNGDDSVSVIDTDAFAVKTTLGGFSEPFAIATGAQANRAYVSTASSESDSIVVIDASDNSVVAAHSLAPSALSLSDLVVSPDGKHAYAGRNGERSADIAVLDTATGQIETVDLATEPGATIDSVRISPDGSRLYVATNGPSGGQLVVVDTHAQAGGRVGKRFRKPRNAATRSRGRISEKGLRSVDTIEIGSWIRDVAVSPDGGIAYVASCGPDFGAVIDVIDTRVNTIISTYKLGEIGGFPTQLTLSADGDRAYLVGDDSVTVLCTLTRDIMGTLTVRQQPSCVIESPDGNYLYVADYCGAITVVSIASISKSPAVEAEDEIAEPDWAALELLHLEPAFA